MSYPMTYVRLLGRNGLAIDYAADNRIIDRTERLRHMIGGDLQRLENDSRDAHHLFEYAKHAGITEPQAKAVLDRFFGSSQRSKP